MSAKLLAIGNVLMGDDGIAIALASALEDMLKELGVEVIYGETDISYSLSRINNRDVVYIMDAARQGKPIGEVSLYNMEELKIQKGGMNGHNISVLELIRLFYPECNYRILTIEVCEVEFHYGLSPLLRNMITDIAREIIVKIEGDLYTPDTS